MEETNFNIDFSTVPNIGDKISSREIQNLNSIFQNPEVIEKLKEIEMYRKKRQKAYGYVSIAMLVITLLVSYFIWKMAAAATAGFFALILVGLFFRVGSGDDSISTIGCLWGLGAFLYWGVYMKYRSKIEIPLKRDIMSRICKWFHEKFKYSYDSKYSFNDIQVLLEKKFLKKYNRLELVEDSVELEIIKDGKGFVLNGYELKTRQVSWSGKNKKNVVTNHEYLMKVVFPYARIPLDCDVHVIPDSKMFGLKQGWKWKKGSWLSMIINIIWYMVMAIVALLIIFSLWLTWWMSYLLFMLAIVWVSVWIFIYAKRRWSVTSKNHVILEDVEFENMFDVYCDDEVASRMILTPAFMDKLVSFVKKTGNTYSFLFTDNTVYIKRKIDRKYLEVGTKKNMFQNVVWFLDFYLDMREILMLSRDMHFMYLSKTVDTSVQKFEVTHNPIPFNNNPVGIMWLWRNRKKKEKIQTNSTVTAS